MSETVVRRRPSTATDAYGNTVPGPATDLDIPGVLVAPASSSEPVPGRGEVASAMTLYLRSSVDAQPTDRWVVRGSEYRQDGDSAEWRTRRGNDLVGTVVTLKRVEG